MQEPILPEATTPDPNKITQTAQNGVLIIKKLQTDPDEVLFYNTDYFKRTGFPEIEVSLVPVNVPVSDKSTMKGGYYKHPEKLTFPFRHFVFLIQREKSGLDTSEMEHTQSTEKESATTYSLPVQKYTNGAYGLFEKLGKYGNNISAKLRISEFAKYTDIAKSTEPQPESGVVDSEKKETEPEPQTETQTQTQTQYFWVVRIPIIESKEIVPLGKYEKMEIRLEQMIKDERVDKSLGKSKEVEEIMVNGRVLRLCKRVKEWSPIKYEMENDKLLLQGSKMDKYSKIIK